MFTIAEILDLAVQIEKNGEKDYRRAAETIPDPELASLFTWLADDEKKHAEWFAGLKSKVAIVPLDEHIAELARDLLGNVLGDQSFALGEADLEKTKSLEKGLALALEFEKDTALFYETLGAFVEDSRDLAHLEEIIAEEKRHIEVLDLFLETGKVPGRE